MNQAMIDAIRTLEREFSDMASELGSAPWISFDHDFIDVTCFRGGPRFVCHIRMKVTSETVLFDSAAGIEGAGT